MVNYIRKWVQPYKKLLLGNKTSLALKKLNIQINYFFTIIILFPLKFTTYGWCFSFYIYPTQVLKFVFAKRKRSYVKNKYFNY